MGACCTKDYNFGDLSGIPIEEQHKDDGRGSEVTITRVQESSNLISMFTQQGRKGINQDAMTALSNFDGDRGSLLAAVFDGHGPAGHTVAQHVCDKLPLNLLLTYRKIRARNWGHEGRGDHNADGYSSVGNNENSMNSFCNSWKVSFIRSFKKMDEELSFNPNIEGYSSGSTAVAIVKQVNDLMIANLGDSRAVLCTRSRIDDRIVAVQLTVDLKPNLPKELERIKRCKGRVFSLHMEPDVYRVWMPEENCPGLAMARAFGDFCLKDYGVISVPQISHRRLTEEDEFVVLATDGIWDVLTNEEVIQIVASAKNRSTAAKILVENAIRAWKNKHPTSKIDDCAAICMFLKPPPPSPPSAIKHYHPPPPPPPDAAESEIGTSASEMGGGGEGETDEWTALQGVSKANSIVNLPPTTSSREHATTVV